MHRYSRIASLLLGLALASPAAWAASRVVDPTRVVAGARFASRLAPGLVEEVVADSLDSPVSFALLPDGRAFVCEQAGRLRVIRDGRLLAHPFVTVPTRADVEEGLLGVAVGPDFARTRHVYVLYTAFGETRRERLVRFTADGDTALAGSDTLLFEGDPHVATAHVGGALRFGPDGFLYVGTGDGERDDLAQSLGSTFGKILRLRPDGGVPADNPFVGTTSGHHGAIWARGFRNPFTLDFEPGTGRLFVNDVGANAWEEVNDVVKGGNYGWPLFEGPSAAERYRSPLYAYGHEAGCAITGGTFVPPGGGTLGRAWAGRWLFGEYCWNELRWLDAADPDRHGVLGTAIVPGPVDVRFAADGALWMLLRGNSAPVGGEHTAYGCAVRVTRSSRARCSKVLSSPRSAGLTSSRASLPSSASSPSYCTACSSTHRRSFTATISPAALRQTAKLTHSAHPGLPPPEFCSLSLFVRLCYSRRNSAFWSINSWMRSARPSPQPASSSHS